MYDLVLAQENDPRAAAALRVHISLHGSGALGGLSCLDLGGNPLVVDSFARWSYFGCFGQSAPEQGQAV